MQDFKFTSKSPVPAMTTAVESKMTFKHVSIVDLPANSAIVL